MEYTEEPQPLEEVAAEPAQVTTVAAEDHLTGVVEEGQKEEAAHLVEPVHLLQQI